MFYKMVRREPSVNSNQNKEKLKSDYICCDVTYRSIYLEQRVGINKGLLLKLLNLSDLFTLRFYNTKVIVRFKGKSFCCGLMYGR